MNFLKYATYVPEGSLKPDFSLISPREKCFEGILDECKHCIAKGEDITDKDVDDVIQKLENYISSQLACEEAVMKRSGYPGLEEHLAQHQLFKDKVWSFRQESHFSREALMTKIYQFSKKWYISHILQMDQEYEDHVETFLRNKF